MFLNKTFPKGFYNLFFTEFGARFGFWGVQSILVLYLVKLFLISDTNSYSIAAAYSALTYCATFIGGTLADKLLGARKILLIGIVFSIVGLVFLSAPNIHSCYLGLAFLVVGMGFYMPTNASLLDHLYTKEDTAREKGYFYLYFATNIGGILGPILFGIAGQYYSYRLGLILYSIALFIMLLVCVIPMRKIHFLRMEAYKKLSKTTISMFFLGLVVATYLCAVLIEYKDLTKDLLFIVGILAVAWILYQSKKEEPGSIKKVSSILFLCLISTLFFAVEFQILNSVITFTRDYVDKKIMFIDVPSSSFVSLEPFFVVMTTPLINAFIQNKASKNVNLSVFSKFSISFLTLGLSFFILYLSSVDFQRTAHQVSPLWLVGSAVFMAIGEVFLMPVLLAIITKESPDRLKNSMVGFLYLCISFSSFFSGVIASFTKTQSSVKEIAGNASLAITGYSQTYFAIFISMISIAVLLFVFGKIVKK